jgi:hypothetical protein
MKASNKATFLVCKALMLFSSLVAPHTLKAQGPSIRMPANLTIFIIRHAEKPTQGDNLAPEGAARAQAYIKYFQEQKNYDGQPVRWNFLFASAETAKSNRPFLTLQPLAEAIRLPISEELKDEQFNDLVAEIRNNDGRKFDNANVLICWHHGEILDLASALGADTTTLPKSAHWPRKWPHDAYGWLLKIYYTPDGTLDVEHTEAINEQLMPDDTMPPP